MNYISQMNGFWRWRREHELPASPQLLWYTLTAEQNYRRWPEAFELSTAALCQLMGGVSINTFRRSRDILVQSGLMKVKMATHGSEISRYHMTQLYDADRSIDGSLHGSADGSANRSKSISTPQNKALQLVPKPNTPNSKDKTPLDKKTGTKEETRPDGTSFRDRLAEPAQPDPAKGSDAAGCGSSRRAVDWEHEQGCGL